MLPVIYDSDHPARIIQGACMHDCPDTCAWQVHVQDGHAVRLEGNPDHPFTRGKLCGKVNHYLERVYHSDRLLYPLKRVGPKGEGKFTRVTWDEALFDVAERWRSIIRDYGAEAILPFSSAGTQGMIQMASLDRRLFGVLGCSNLDRGICGQVASTGLADTNGSPFGVDPEEFVHSRFIVLWGTNTLITNIHLWPVINEARRRGAQLVVVDPIRTRTAEQADWHIAPRPATDTALCLAMMHVMIRDGWVDHDYVTKFAEGYEELVRHVQKYTPEYVSAITGLSADEIERFARAYATTTPSLLRPLIGPEHHRNGAMIFRTMACLPILIGAWRHRGGGLSRSVGALQYSVLNHEGLVRPETSKPDVRTLNMRDLGSILCSSTLAPPIKSLCVWNSNPVVSIPNQNRIREGLSREDLFVVAHDLFLSETASYADYVFPATSQMEQLDLMPAWGHHYLAMNRPAIAPRGECVPNTEFFRRLAKALGRTESFLFDSDETLVRTALESKHPYLDGITFERLWDSGFERLNHERDWRPFLNGFATPNRKARLWSQPLADAGFEPLPSVGEIRTPEQGQLQLITGKSLHLLNGSYSQSEHHCNRAGDLRIEMHPVDAQDRAIESGQLVTVSNHLGELIAQANISNRVRPGVVWMPFGGFGDALGIKRSVNALTPEEPTEWGGGSGFYDAFVFVTPHPVHAQA